MKNKKIIHYNAGRIVKDSNNNVFLKVAGIPLDKAVYFHIDEFITEPKGRVIGLSKAFLINLKGEK